MCAFRYASRGPNTTSACQHNHLSDRLCSCNWFDTAAILVSHKASRNISVVCIFAARVAAGAGEAQCSSHSHSGLLARPRGAQAEWLDGTLAGPLDPRL